MIRFKCRQCGGRIEAPASMLGKGETCPVCGAIQAVRRPFPVLMMIVLLLCFAAVGFSLYSVKASMDRTREQDRQIEESSQRFADQFSPSRR